MMMQLCMSDPRFMDVFKEITGIDLMDLQEQKMKEKDEAEDMKKKREAEEKVRKEEEERKKKLAEEEALPDEEKEKRRKVREAEAFKAEGNNFYKAKKFSEALEKYQAAIDTNPDEITYYSNVAAVYFEMKEFDKCIEFCDKGIETTKGKPYDYAKLAKAISRKANAFLQKGDCDKAIELYDQALLENKDHGIKMAL